MIYKATFLKHRKCYLCDISCTATLNFKESFGDKSYRNLMRKVKRRYHFISENTTSKFSHRNWTISIFMVKEKNEKELAELASKINYHGEHEEFHQKNGNVEMRYYHKNRRLEAQERYDKLKLA